MSFVAFSADGSMIASNGPAEPEDASSQLTLWSFPDGRLIKRIPVRPTAISRDWKYYSSSHSVGEISSGRTLISLPADEYALNAFSPDSHYVAESSLRHSKNGPTIRIVELSSGKEVGAYGRYRAFALSISPDAKTLATGHWNEVVLRDLLTGKKKATYQGMGRYVVGLSFSADGRRLAVGSDLGGIQIWDTSSNTMLWSLKFDGQYVSAPAFSPDDSMIAVGIYGTGTAWVIDVASGKVIDSQKVSDIGCGSVAFSPDGKYLIAPSTGGLIKWPYDRGGTVRVFHINR